MTRERDASPSSRIRECSDDISAQMAQFFTSTKPQGQDPDIFEIIAEHIIRCKGKRSLIRNIRELVREPPQCRRWGLGSPELIAFI